MRPTAGWFERGLGRLTAPGLVRCQGCGLIDGLSIAYVTRVPFRWFLPANHPESGKQRHFTGHREPDKQTLG